MNNGSFGAEITSPGIILLGTITWINQSNWNDGFNWNSGVNLLIDFAPLTNPPPSFQSVAFSIQNTPDPSDDTDTNEETGLNSDVIDGMALSPTGFGAPIFLGEGLVLTSFFFDMYDAGSAGSEVGYGGFGSLYNSETGRWENREGVESTIGLFGNIDNVTVSAVPLPAALPLFGAALAIFGFIRLRISR
ncbi:MAG: hypothetical protein V7723_02025 [Sneathiella sp.]|uniref:hypothetical protein n=1 Tax=Sneathiella sp. TaxID=1964365 RepID=UPI0030025C9D